MDPDQTVPLGTVSSGSTLFVCMPKLALDISIYMQQTTSADYIFRCIFLQQEKGLSTDYENKQNVYIVYLLLNCLCMLQLT